MSITMDIAKEIFPDIADKELDDIIWMRTGYPNFWNLKQEDNKSIEKCFRRQLLEYKEAAKLCIKMCPLCTNEALPNKSLCARCEKSIKIC